MLTTSHVYGQGQVLLVLTGNYRLTMVSYLRPVYLFFQLQAHYFILNHPPSLKWRLATAVVFVVLSFYVCLNLHAF